MRRLGRRDIRAVALVAALVLTLGVTPSALAAPAPPSWDDVEQAQGDVEATEIAIARIEDAVRALDEEYAAAALALVIPVAHVDAKIGLAITALLALVAMHWGVSSGLPDAGYLVMIDVFYLLAYAAVTAILAVTVAGVWMVRSRGEQAATAMERRMLVMIGGVLLVVLVAVLLFYLPHT